MSKILNLAAAAMVCGGLLIGGVSSAQATTVFSDNFNGDSQQLNQFNLINWTVDSGSIDVIGTGGPWDFYPGNGNYVDLDGSTGQAGTITTKNSYSFALGQQYKLEFDLGVNADGHESTYSETLHYFASVIGLFDTFLPLPSGGIPTFLHYVIPFIGNGSLAKISFGALGGDNQGPVLDNVLISVVPLPAGLPLLAGGLALLGLFGLRKKRGLAA